MAKAKKSIAAAAYLRYSSTKQHQTSLDRQELVIKDWARRNGVEIIEIFSDPAHSATDAESRPEFMRMYHEALKRERFDTILCYDYSRLFRNNTQAAYYREELRYHGVKIISVTQPIEEGPNGRMQEGVFDLMNSYTSDLNSKTTHDSMAHKAKSGCGYLGGKVPLGYILAADDTLEIDEEEASVVRLAFDMYLNDYTYQQIADTLNDRGYRTKDGSHFKKSSFQSMFEQTKYCGIWTWNKSKPKNVRLRTKEGRAKPEDQWIVVEGGCPAIISKETFDAVQKKMQERGECSKANLNRKHYMLKGLVRCASCGEIMTPTVRSSHGRHYTVYFCPNQKADKCNTKEIRAAELELFAASVTVRYLLTKKDWKTVQKATKTFHDRAKLRKLRSRQEILKRKSRNLCKELAKISSDTLREQLQSTEQQIRVLQTEIDAVKTERNSIVPDNRKKLKMKLRDYLIDSPAPEVRDFLKTLISEILVNNDGVSVELKLE